MDENESMRMIADINDFTFEKGQRILGQLPYAIGLMYGLAASCETESEDQDRRAIAVRSQKALIEVAKLCEDALTLELQEVTTGLRYKGLIGRNLDAVEQMSVALGRAANVCNHMPFVMHPVLGEYFQDFRNRFDALIRSSVVNEPVLARRV